MAEVRHEEVPVSQFPDPVGGSEFTRPTASASNPGLYDPVRLEDSKLRRSRVQYGNRSVGEDLAVTYHEELPDVLRLAGKVEHRSGLDCPDGCLLVAVRDDAYPDAVSYFDTAVERRIGATGDGGQQ